MAAIGLVSAFGLCVYGLWTYRVASRIEAGAQSA
jgi:hypothetical protein